MASGYATTIPFPDVHWRKGKQDRKTNYIYIDFDVLLNPEKEPILSLDLLNTGQLAAQQWTPQTSGISIRPNLVEELEALWFDFLTTSPIRQPPFVVTGGPLTPSDRTPLQVTLTAYEKNPYARQVCTDEHGQSCTVCGFNFAERYG